MAFNFNLEGDDIDLDEEIIQERLPVQKIQTTAHDVPILPVQNYYIGEVFPEDVPTSLFLRCLPSSISYESIKITAPQNTSLSEYRRQNPEANSAETPHIVVRRRPTYDILLQLKAEADAEINDNARLISAMEGNDRQSGVYEGGLKTWEGALDLASLVKEINFQDADASWHIVELGAGSALPSIVALRSILSNSQRTGVPTNTKSFHLTLSDYNDEILRLSTYANVLLASKEDFEGREGQHDSLSEQNYQLDIDEQLVRDSYRVWKGAGLSLNFISGPWGRDFEAAITHPGDSQQIRLLILASETIYDLETLPVFTDMVINLLRQHGAQSKAWVAAKKLYFGVGGGVDAFIHEVKSRGGRVCEIMKTKQGVSRVVLEITVCKE